MPFPAGGQLDVVVRMVADKIAPALGQPIVVETHTGADGNIGAELVAKSAPDGYTWLATSVPFATQISLQPKTLRYDPLRDFVPIANLGTASFVLVRARVGARQVAARVHRLREGAAGRAVLCGHVGRIGHAPQHRDVRACSRRRRW